jgi:transposase InsO family protein
VLDRSFEAPAPNRKWIADFTYVWTAEGWLYVAAVVDLFSRRVVGWSMNAAMTAQLVTDALLMAIWRRGKPYSSGVGRLVRLHVSGEDLALRLALRSVDAGRGSGRC